MPLINLEQVNRRFVDVLRVFGIALFRLLRIQLDDFGKPDDGVQRRAQFMRHVGEKLGLGAIGCLGAWPSARLASIGGGLGVCCLATTAQDRDAR